MAPHGGGDAPVRFEGKAEALWTCGRNGLLRWPIRDAADGAGKLRVGPPEILAVDVTEKGVVSDGSGRLIAIHGKLPPRESGNHRAIWCTKPGSGQNFIRISGRTGGRIRGWI